MDQYDKFVFENKKIPSSVFLRTGTSRESWVPAESARSVSIQTEELIDGTLSMRAIDNGAAPVIGSPAPLSIESWTITRTCSVSSKIYNEKPNVRPWKRLEPKITAIPRPVHFWPRLRPKWLGPPSPTKRGPLINHQVSRKPVQLRLGPANKPPIPGLIAAPPVKTSRVKITEDRILPAVKSPDFEERAVRSKLELNQRREKLKRIFEAPIQDRKKGIKFISGSSLADPQIQQKRPKIEKPERLAAEFALPIRKKTAPVRPGITKKPATTVTADVGTSPIQEKAVYSSTVQADIDLTQRVIEYSEKIVPSAVNNDEDILNVNFDELEFDL